MLDVDRMVETRDRVHIAMRDVTPDLVEIRKVVRSDAGARDSAEPDDMLARRLLTSTSMVSLGTVSAV